MQCDLKPQVFRDKINSNPNEPPKLGTFIFGSNLLQIETLAH